jgi:AcrR family transcriptional regulator
MSKHSKNQNTLSEEKNQRLLEAGLEEFSRLGFEGASTNAITKQAGVAKGLLFHHFGSKRDFFLFVLYSVSTRVTNELIERLGRIEAIGLFSSLAAWARIRLMIQIKLKREFSFLSHCFNYPLDEMYSEIRSIRLEQESALGEVKNKLFLSRLNGTPLRDGIERKVAVSFSVMVVERLVDEFYQRECRDNQYPNSSLLLQELITTLDFVKHGILQQTTSAVEKIQPRTKLHKIPILSARKKKSLSL